jgi:hypothetical protein
MKQTKTTQLNNRKKLQDILEVIADVSSSEVFTPL